MCARTHAHTHMCTCIQLTDGHHGALQHWSDQHDLCRMQVSSHNLSHTDGPNRVKPSLAHASLLSRSHSPVNSPLVLSSPSELWGSTQLGRGRLYRLGAPSVHHLQRVYVYVINSTTTTTIRVVFIAQLGLHNPPLNRAPQGWATERNKHKYRPNTHANT
jgi:hypothetical protein